MFTNIFLYILKAENTQLDAKFIEFQMSLMKVKEWLTKADSAISSHDHLPVIQRLSEYEQEKMKVGCLENSLLFIDIVYAFFHFFKNWNGFVKYVILVQLISSFPKERKE